MSLRVWEIGVVLIATLVALLLGLGGAIALACVTFAVGLVWALGRVGILERPGLAGGFAGLKSKVELARTAGLYVVLLAVVATMFAADYSVGARRLRSALPCLLWEQSSSSSTVRLIGRERSRSIGSRALTRRRLSAASFEPLRERGWLVIHDLAKDRGGNIDHVVCGRNGA